MKTEKNVKSFPKRDAVIWKEELNREIEKGSYNIFKLGDIMAYFTLMKWLSTESRTDKCSEGCGDDFRSENFEKVKWCWFYIYVLRLALEEAGVVWPQLQEWKQHILLQLQWAHISLSLSLSHTHTHTQIFFVLHHEKTAKA